jgi:hypothetical protein
MFLTIIFPLFNGLDDLAEELYGMGMEACPLHQKCVRSAECNPSPEKVVAPLLAINFVDDELNPDELGVLEAKIRKVKRGHAIIVPVGPKSKGNQSLRIAEVWAPYVQSFMEETFVKRDSA